MLELSLPRRCDRRACYVLTDVLVISQHGLGLLQEFTLGSLDILSGVAIVFHKREETTIDVELHHHELAYFSSTVVQGYAHK